MRNLTQYAYVDEPLRSGGGGWQSGLRFADGRAKGSLSTIRHPFWAERRDRRTVRVWGQVRPGAATTVRIERTSRTGRWIRVADVRTTSRGLFHRDVRISSGARWRFRHGGGTLYSGAPFSGGTSSTWTVR